MSEYWKNIGLFWQPLGGNNIDQISGHCYQYTDVVNFRGKPQITTIIVDVGKFDNYQALHIADASAAVPDIRPLLQKKSLNLQAIFLTHSHPDHLNGIVHYIKAGYRLPPLYGGKYTKMILDDLLAQFGVLPHDWPEFHIIQDNDIITLGSLKILALASSHTCFDSFGFVIQSENAVVYHTGDMKIDQSTYFRKPTNIKKIKELAPIINYVVADFSAIFEDGFAVKEVDTFKKLVEIIAHAQKDKIFLPVYPTHPEMYIIAFLAALKLKKNVVFFGNPDFYSYLNKIIEYGISFTNLAQNRIKVIFSHDREEISTLDNNYVVIGTYNHISLAFDANYKNSFGIITAKTFFNPLKGQLNAHNIKFVSVDDYPVLQGFGHGFLKDYEYLNSLLQNPIFLPTHCPTYVIDYFRELADFIGMKLIPQTPKNAEIYQLKKEDCLLVSKMTPLWLAVSYRAGRASFAEVLQAPTSGDGFLKRTISQRKCQRRIKMCLQRRKRASL